jgi:hypothetical protein
VTIARTGSSAVVAAGQVVSFKLDGVKNPEEEGMTAVYPVVKTTMNNVSVAIDEASVDHNEATRAEGQYISPSMNFTSTPFMPAEINKTFGSSSSFAVAPEWGTPPYFYEWQSSGTAIAGANFSNYSLYPLVTSHSGIITCKVSDSTIINAHGMRQTHISEKLDFTVAKAIAITTHPVEKHMVQGETAVYTVAVEGGSIPYAYQWWHRVNDSNAEVGTNHNELSVNNAQIADEGNYFVVVTDAGGGAPATSTRAELTVNVEPQLGPSAATVLENTALAHVLLTIQATDANVNDTLRYSISSGNDDRMFYIGEFDGKIRVSRDGVGQLFGLNNEQDDSYSLVVTATDNGMPPLTASAAATIAIEDTNDDPSLLLVSREQTATNSDTSPMTDGWSQELISFSADGPLHGMWGTEVVEAKKTFVLNETLYPHLNTRIRLRYWAVNATVSDGTVVVGNRTVWKVTNNTRWTNFVREGASSSNSPFLGFKTLAKGVWYTDIDVSVPHTESDLQVAVTGNPDTAQTSWGFGRLTVTVDALRSVHENSRVNTTVGLPIEGTDADEGHALTYSLGTSADTQPFGIDAHTGQIFVAVPVLDKERKQKYNFTVYTSDEKRAKAAATVTVMILDTNDAPIISHLQALTVDELTVEYNYSFPRSVGYVNASDQDLALSGDILTYELIGQENGWHTVACGSGAIGESHSCGVDPFTGSTSAVRPSYLSEDQFRHEVSCCSDVVVLDWFKRDCKGSDLWVTSGSRDGNPFRCADSSNFTTAAVICARNGGRLCTHTEVDSGCTAGSGCAHDTDHVWTSTPLNATFFTLDSSTGEMFLQEPAVPSYVAKDSLLNFERKSSYAIELKVTDDDGISHLLNSSVELQDINEPPLWCCDYRISAACALTAGNVIMAKDPSAEHFEYLGYQKVPDACTKAITDKSVEIVKKLVVSEGAKGALGHVDSGKTLPITSNDENKIPLSFYVYDPDTMQSPVTALSFSVVDWDDMTDGVDIDLSEYIEVGENTGQLNVKKIVNGDLFDNLEFSMTISVSDNGATHRKFNSSLKVRLHFQQMYIRLRAHHILTLFSPPPPSFLVDPYLKDQFRDFHSE